MRKRRFLYWSAAFGALTVVVLMNYYCYRAAMGKYTQLSRSYHEEIAGAVQKEVSKQVEVKFEDLSEGLPVANTEEMLSVNTVYQIENYDKVKDQTTTEYETIPEELVGFNREEADGYFKKYMQNLPVEEFLNGLQSIGITTFSKDRIIVRKIYDPSKVKYRYYLIAVDGEVVVYYGDQKTVYEYTGISTDTLSKEEQMSLKNGIEVKDEESAILIYPGTVKPGIVSTYDDHRMAMAFALLGIRAEGIVIDNCECCRKTFEDYFKVLDRVLA